MKVKRAGMKRTREATDVDAEAPQPVTEPSTPAPPPPSVPAGWYPRGDVQEYWDGSAWTGHTAPIAP